MSLVEHRHMRRCSLRITATLENRGSCEGSQGSVFNGSMAAVETGSQMKTWFTKNILPSCVSADQVYGDQDMHEVVRKHCMDYLVRHPPTPTHHPHPPHCCTSLRQLQKLQLLTSLVFSRR